MRLPVKPSDANAHSEQSGFLASERVKGPFPLDCIGDLCYRSGLGRDLVWMGPPYTFRPSLIIAVDPISVEKFDLFLSQILQPTALSIINYQLSITMNND